MNSMNKLAGSTWLLVALAGCTQPKTPTVVTASTAPPRTVVTVVRAAKEPLIDSLTLNAEFQPSKEVEVMSRVSGYVRKLYVEIGDRVTAGQLLATLEAPETEDEVAKALAAVERSQSEVERARTEVQRAETSHQMAHLTAERIAAVSRNRPGMLAPQEVDDARNRDLIAESQVDTAKSSLAAALKAVQVSEAESKKARTLLTYLQVTAPFAGVVTKRYVDSGAMVQAGTSSRTQAMPVVRISQSDLLRVVLPVPEFAVSQLKIGDRVQLRATSTQRSIEGRIARFSNRIHTETRTMEAEVDVLNPGGLILPGMSVEARLQLAQPVWALAIPLTAIDLAAAQPTTKVVSRGNIEVRTLVLGARTATKAVVREGLREGDRVVVSAPGELQSGQQVDVKEPATATAGGRN